MFDMYARRFNQCQKEIGSYCYLQRVFQENIVTSLVFRPCIVVVLYFGDNRLVLDLYKFISTI